MAEPSRRGWSACGRSRLFRRARHGRPNELACRPTEVSLKSPDKGDNKAKKGLRERIKYHEISDATRLIEE